MTEEKLEVIAVVNNQSILDAYFACKDAKWGDIKLTKDNIQNQFLKYYLIDFEEQNRRENGDGRDESTSELWRKTWIESCGRHCIVDYGDIEASWVSFLNLDFHSLRATALITALATALVNQYDDFSLN
jgi:hypothetical protein